MQPTIFDGVILCSVIRKGVSVFVERQEQNNVLRAFVAIALFAVTILTAQAADPPKTSKGSAGTPSPSYIFGWQKFTPVDGSWSVLMPNEPEPGRSSLEQSGGKTRLVDGYGLLDACDSNNMKDIKTTTHFYSCATENKRVTDPGNREKFSVSCTTYASTTLKERFGDDVNKILDDAVDDQVRRYQIAPGINNAKLIREENVSCGSVAGREFEVHHNKSGSVVRIGRIFWVNDRLYELAYWGVGKADLSACTKFLTSFELK